MIIPIGTLTQYGTIAAVGWAGERYYWMTNVGGVTSMIPAAVLEAEEQLEIRFEGMLDDAEGC